MIVSVQKWYSQEEIGEVYQWILRATYADIQKIPSLKELKELMQGIAGCMSQRETVSVKQYSKPIRESLSLIEKNYKSNISLEEICEEVAVSKNYFCYLFKRETGMNLWNYLTMVRLQHAKELLRDTELHSYEISFAVGYENPSYFSKLFKKYEGMSPKEYRRRKKEY